MVMQFSSRGSAALSGWSTSNVMQARSRRSRLEISRNLAIAQMNICIIITIIDREMYDDLKQPPLQLFANAKGC